MRLGRRKPPPDLVAPSQVFHWGGRWWCRSTIVHFRRRPERIRHIMHSSSIRSIRFGQLKGLAECSGGRRVVARSATRLCLRPKASSAWIGEPASSELSTSESGRSRLPALSGAATKRSSSMKAAFARAGCSGSARTEPNPKPPPRSSTPFPSVGSHLAEACGSRIDP